LKPTPEKPLAEMIAAAMPGAIASHEKQKLVEEHLAKVRAARGQTEPGKLRMRLAAPLNVGGRGFRTPLSRGGRPLRRQFLVDRDVISSDFGDTIAPNSERIPDDEAARIRTIQECDELLELYAQPLERAELAVKRRVAEKTEAEAIASAATLRAEKLAQTLDEERSKLEATQSAARSALGDDFKTILTSAANVVREPTLPPDAPRLKYIGPASTTLAEEVVPGGFVVPKGARQ
jgi:hypothetical protein